MHTIKVGPLLIGIGLWFAATCLLLEEAWHRQVFDVATLSTPILTLGTIGAAVLAHLRFARFRLIGGTGFALLALLGSTVMVSGTLGRLATVKDEKEATVGATNRTYGNKADDLKAAKTEQARECKSIGKRCEAWNARVDVLTRELSGIVVKSTDPKSDAAARLAVVIGFKGDRVKEVVGAFDPILVPLFLELGSIGFFAGAFGHRRNRKEASTLPSIEVTVAASPAPSVTKLWTQDDALQDLRKLRPAPAQHILAERWGVNRSTVSRWMKDWHAAGAIDRNRVGKEMLALPAPRKGRLS